MENTPQTLRKGQRVTNQVHSSLQFKIQLSPVPNLTVTPINIATFLIIKVTLLWAEKKPRQSFSYIKNSLIQTRLQYSQVFVAH